MKAYQETERERERERERKKSEEQEGNERQFYTWEGRASFGRRF
jgi:hypothetical protein